MRELLALFHEYSQAHEGEECRWAIVFYADGGGGLCSEDRRGLDDLPTKLDRTGWTTLEEGIATMKQVLREDAL